MGVEDDLEQQQPLRHEKPDFEVDDDDFRGSGGGSSSPPARSSSYSLHPLIYIGSWIFFSNTTILFNKWLIDTKGFRYPVILTCWHLIFATIATQLLARTTTLLDSRHTVKMTGRLYLRAIVPIGLFYSASLVCSNMVYLYLSVAFIQMLKAAAPVAVLFVAWVWGVENPSLQKLINILVIAAGVALASFGEIAFSWAGFLYQLGGIVFEAMRLVMIQVLLSENSGQKMDPLVSLYYYAPVCAVMNMLVALVTEAFRFDFADLGKAGYGLLLLNAGVAFMLNVSSVFLIGKTSSLVMTLTGILKNILLVIASVMIWHTSITLLQFLGYGIALAGLIYYSVGWDNIVAIYTGARAYLSGVFDSLLSTSTSPEDGGKSGGGVNRMPFALRRALVMGLALLGITLVLALGGLWYTAEGGVDLDPA